ncbi:MAG TPA: NAD(P)-dependent oxidoreductase [Pyrinomonadaceae bacterium]|nr:NAD(P)-dependent oxidoreductase [Pyrinomonadaceae bacterium]
MRYSHLAPLEVTHALLDRAIASQLSLDADTALVTVQHMLEQTVDLFETIADLGLRHQNIFALGKVYSNSSVVIQTLRQRGVTVVDSTMPEPGKFDQYFEQDCRRLWQVVAEALARRRIKRILVLDDGGFCITTVPPELLQRYPMCGVEQTSLGMFLFEEKPPPFAVFSWARAAVKLEIGGPIFSQCLIDRLTTGLRERSVFQRAQLGVIGLGSIGRAMANLAAREAPEEKQVLFYDPRTNLQICPTLRRHITRVESLEELMMRCDCVIGCSGRNPFNNNWPLNHKPGIRLLSGSGGDQEFGPIINYLKTKPDFHVGEDTWDVSSKLGPCGPIHIAYLGYPYNFVSRAPEAVPTRIVQLETGGLLAALIQAHLYLELFETGLARNSGIHRVSPGAQRFVYEEWLRAMRALKLDPVKLFGYDRAMLSAAQHEAWFAKNSELYPGSQDWPVRTVEEEMNQIFCLECNQTKSRRAAG